MATTDENHPMNLIAMETQSTPFHPGNNPVLMLVAGLSCMIAGIIKLVQCNRQYGLTSMIALVYYYSKLCGLQLTIGLSFATAGLFLVWSAYKLVPVNRIHVSEY
jgi:hypothetical protein